MSSRSWFSAALVLAAAAPAPAQPTPAGAPSPLLLVQGIREGGMPDLAREYLKEVEPRLTPQDRALVPLERAKCLLSTAEDEPDEGTRTSMVGEAKEGFNAFLIANSKHPRASEASLALARLTSIEAKAQLNRARRMDVPAKDDPGYDEAIGKQRAEMVKARPLFLTASKQFAAASAQLKERLKDSGLDPAARYAIEREVFDADLASAVNKFNLADTFVVTGAADSLERNKYIEEARAIFAELAKGPPTSRDVWVARAWMAELLAEQGKAGESADEFNAIVAARARRVEAEDGKRMVEFFRTQRKFLKETLSDPVTTGKLQTSAREWRDWLRQYGKLRKPTPEVLTAKYMLALSAQLQAQSLMGPPPKPPAPAPKLTTTQETLLKEAEKLYRELGQSDNDYTARAGRNRMVVVRRLLGEADRPPSAYTTFEDAQMAALIQMAKLGDAEKLRDTVAEDDEAPFWARTAQEVRVAHARAEVEDRKYRVISLLEHAREIATDRDNSGDVTDNLLRLVYFYQLTDQPYQAAVLGEHIARTIKTTGGKGATAGVMALNGYVQASARVKAEAPDPTDTAQVEAVQAAAAAARKIDRERAIRLARFLDEKFPNDTPTDAARHRLALLLNEEGRADEAFDAAARIRPGYSAAPAARQLQGYLAAVIVTSAESRATPERKRDVFRRAVLDLGKVAKPGNAAPEEDVRGFLSCRLRLAQLLLSQNRADSEAEANPETRGYKRALEIADEVIGTIPTFESLADKEKKAGLPEGLNLDGLELRVQAFDIRTRALYLRGKSLVDEKQFPAAGAAIAPVVADIGKVDAAFAAKVQQWAGGNGDAADDPDAAQKKKIADLAAGIDKVRRDIVMVGFKLHAVQGQPAEATKMLDLLRAAGGGIDSNQRALELMARELAAHIPLLRKEGKANEAKALGEGLGILLKEFTAAKDLQPNTILFLGQTFHTVEQHEEALAQLGKIKPPTMPPSLKLKPDTQWWQVEPKMLENIDIQERKKFQDSVRDYRFAQLYTGKALRGAGKLAEAEKLFKDAVGDQKAKGYAYSSLDFRKELAHTYEAKAAAQTDSKAANGDWAKALAEWTTLFRIAQDQVRQIKPKTDADPGTPPEEAKRLRNNFFDAFFEPQRVVVTANAQLIKNPADLEKSYARVAKSFNDLETINKFNDLVEIDTPQGKVTTTVGEEMVLPEVAARYWELIDTNPALKGAYKAAGGKFFLTKPKGVN
jgi:hypothetical protein